MANYLPVVEQDGWIYVSGQLPMEGGALTCTGKVGAEVGVDEAYQAARLCAINGRHARALSCLFNYYASR